MKPNLLTKACWVLFFIFSLFTSSLQAQRFEWAKGYASSQEGNRIIGQVTDSVGNLYILGTFRNSAAWDGGSHLLPMAPYGPAFDVTNVLIAKITPDGEMVWKKVLHTNNGLSANAFDIKPVGDTAFACMVMVYLPTESNYCYYLDTLLIGRGNYPTPNGEMGIAQCTALIVFDYEGHVLEQHFLTLTYIDNNGMDFKYGEWYMNNGYMLNASFDIDSEGNIYLCRTATDYGDATHSSWQGTISGIKYWVDGHVVGISSTDNRPMGWFPQLLKFSPHMDTLIATRYLVQKCDSVEYQADNLYMRLDRDGNPYVVGTLCQNGRGYNNILHLDTTRNITLKYSSSNDWKGYLVKLNPSLDIVHLIDLKDSNIRTDLLIANTIFQDIAFDYDSNYLFINATAGIGTATDTINMYSFLSCQNITLTNLRNDAFIMVFRQQDDTLKFLSYGRALAKYASVSIISSTHGTISCAKNRVFLQSDNMGGIRYPGQTHIFNNWGDWGLGLNIFDYKGNVIGGIYYNCISSTNNVGSVTHHQNTLYLTNVLTAAATFGDIHVPAQGYNACVAKYVDTSFMTPYVYTGDTGNVRIVVSEAGTWVSYPNPFRQRVTIESDGQEVRTAWLTDLTGRREEVRLQAAGTGRYVLDLTGRPQATYLLTLVTADGQERTLRLLKQQDMFGE